MESKKIYILAAVGVVFIFFLGTVIFQSIEIKKLRDYILKQEVATELTLPTTTHKEGFLTAEDILNQTEPPRNLEYIRDVLVNLYNGNFISSYASTEQINGEEEFALCIKVDIESVSELGTMISSDDTLGDLWGKCVEKLRKHSFDGGFHCVKTVTGATLLVVGQGSIIVNLDWNG